jgi:hypothetical protein
MASTKQKLLARHHAMHMAGERLEQATQARDEAIFLAQTEMNKSEIARLLGVRRETIYNAILRVEARMQRERREDDAEAGS